jgi:hypothetical protein
VLSSRCRELGKEIPNLEYRSHVEDPNGRAPLRPLEALRIRHEGWEHRNRVILQETCTA